MKITKYFSKMNLISVLACGFIFIAPTISHSISVEHYKLSGVEDSYWDEDVPAALRVTVEEDGLPAGTILYRTSYKDVDYYSPIAPKSIQGTQADPNQGRYDNWGPWCMVANKTKRNIEATTYYPSGT